CVDGIDTADPEDTLVDGSDPGCTDPQDDDERNGPLPRTTAAELPRTGGDDSTTLPVAGGLALLALGALALRRRSQTAG
ncbi:MAG: LPXTG cell wall anchor domain-containing protein, partial [Acidimicrobiales bacterium]